MSDAGCGRPLCGAAAAPWAPASSSPDPSAAVPTFQAPRPRPPCPGAGESLLRPAWNKPRQGLSAIKRLGRSCTPQPEPQGLALRRAVPPLVCRERDVSEHATMPSRVQRGVPETCDFVHLPVFPAKGLRNYHWAQRKERKGERKRAGEGGGRREPWAGGVSAWARSPHSDAFPRRGPWRSEFLPPSQRTPGPGSSRGAGAGIRRVRVTAETRLTASPVGNEHCFRFERVGGIGRGRRSWKCLAVGTPGRHLCLHGTSRGCGPLVRP